MQTKSRKNLSKSQNILTKSFFLFSFLHQYTPIDSLEELPAPPFRAACSSPSNCLFLPFELSVPPFQTACSSYSTKRERYPRVDIGLLV